MNQYYKTLGLSSDASLEDVKIAFRKLSKKFHPDVNQGDKYFEERFKEIQEAYEKIINQKTKTNNNFKHPDPSEKKMHIKLKIQITTKKRRTIYPKKSIILK